MNMKTICAIGLKILAAGLAGIAVFIGIGQLSKNKSQSDESVSSDECDHEVNESSEVNINTSENSVKSGDKIVDNLRKVQDTCSKVFTVIQSLTIVADNLSRVFGKKGPGYTQSYFGRDPWSYSQPIDMGNGQVWNRISPYIIEVPPTNRDPRSPYSI